MFNDTERQNEYARMMECARRERLAVGSVGAKVMLISRVHVADRDGGGLRLT